MVTPPQDRTTYTLEQKSSRSTLNSEDASLHWLFRSSRYTSQQSKDVKEREIRSFADGDYECLELVSDTSDESIEKYSTQNKRQKSNTSPPYKVQEEVTPPSVHSMSRPSSHEEILSPKQTISDEDRARLLMHSKPNQTMVRRFRREDLLEQEENKPPTHSKEKSIFWRCLSYYFSCLDNPKD